MIKVLVLTALFNYAICGNLVDVLQQNGESTLISLVQQAGLANTLLGDTFTIFAPTNAAFAKLSNATLTDLSKDANALADLLKYHVVKGTIMKQDAADDLKLTTLAGTPLRFNYYQKNNVYTVEGIKITTFDLPASNGVVHIIDSVLTPPADDIVTQLSDHADFTSLVNLLKSAGLVDPLKGDNLTVFAPSNAAFARLGSRITANLVKNPPLLQEILEYHVVTHVKYSAGLYDHEYLTTQDRYHDRLRITKHSTGLYVNQAHITQADISATNGVIHTINQVLVPPRDYIQLLFGRK